MPRALVTGGTGYIGSHTCVVLLDAGWDVIVIDNLANSSQVSLDRVRELAPAGQLTFHEVDLLDGPGLDAAFGEAPVDAVVHFAGLKSVGESVAEPLKYFENNVAGTVQLLKVMDARGVRNLVFSSSATVYGDPEFVPITESARLSTTNPYGRTKLQIEDMLRDVAASDPRWHMALLRYFNPVGAHPSGRIGEDPAGIPNNLMPFVMQVAVGKRDHVTVHGGDWPTPDGTGVRDYIHVVDLAEGHLAALQAIEQLVGAVPVNLGTGNGSSVLEVIAAASAASGREIPHEIGPRRPGDIAAVWADPATARDVLGWTASRSLDEMCVDHWRWQESNPEGFGSATLAG
ncbi:MAG: UDP-glucose 4-epimerase [Actinomycetia bacterium]|nr:UDP-glucose 4-epimerase [Actinomycetes bacterium]